MIKLKSLPFYFIGLTLLGACGGYQYHPAETIADKMDRYKANNPNPNPALNLKASPDLLKKKASRGIASTELPESYGLKHSDKRLYFLSLLSQYDLMRNMVSNETPSITICPHFHSSVVEYKEIQGSQTGKLSVQSLAQAGVDPSLFPELQLKISNQGATLSEEISGDNKQKALEQALTNHAKNTFNELRELCEYGVSDNFYAFENLMTHIKDKGLAKNSDSANVLFKTPIYANDLIINSLNYKKSNVVSRGPASSAKVEKENNYLRELSARMNTHWYYEYVENLKQIRQN